MKRELLTWLESQIDADPDLLRAAINREILYVVFCYEAKIDGEWGCNHGSDQIRAGQCEDPDDFQIVRLVGLTYKDNAGYRDEWRPEFQAAPFTT